VLAELAGLGLGLARDLQARALAAETPDEAAKLANAFHRIARSVRQTLALDARLAREHSRQAKDDAAEADVARAGRVEARRRQLKLALERVAWDEYEDDDAEMLLGEIGELVELAAAGADFLDQPLDVQLARLRADLGMDADAPAEDADAETEYGAEEPEPDAAMDARVGGEAAAVARPDWLGETAPWEGESVGPSPPRAVRPDSS
jgi:hypothetical protein